MKTVETDIRIEAPPARVWQVLTDFASHDRWDPFLASIEGKLEAGARLVVRFRKGWTFKPRVTDLKPGERLEWLGSLGVRGLFDGRHHFELHAENGGTRLRHGEQFSGILVPLFGRGLRDTEAGFAAFNRAIKAEAEAGWAKSGA
jgi:hypothetical protein